jgi:sugar/nucleoside kinase (ribokinase family)
MNLQNEEMMALPIETDILMIGHFAKDILVVDGRAEVSSGGGVYYGSIALRHLGLNVAVVTRLHPDDFARLETLEQAGVELFATPAPETSGIENIYSSANMDRRICKPLGFAGPFVREDIPDITPRLVSITPIIAGEVDLPLLKMLAERGPVALDVQGFVRVRDNGNLVFREWLEMEEGLSHVTYLKLDRAEAELLTGETDLRLAVRQLARFGPRELLITEMSGVTVFASGDFYEAPFTPRSLAGRTGRGDTCFAVYLGKRLSDSPLVACRLAAAVTSLKQEQPGPWNGSLADVEVLGSSW